MTNRNVSSSGRGGVARGLAVALDIPPELAVRGGAPAVAAMMELKQGMDAGGGWLRENHVARAQEHLAGLDPRQHGDLLRHLQGCVIALGGRRGDTEIAHVTPGEMVIPDDLMTPEVVDLLRRAAKEKGLDPERFVVGGKRNSINPRTGLREFFNDGYNDDYLYVDDRLSDPTLEYAEETKPGTDWTPYHGPLPERGVEPPPPRVKPPQPVLPSPPPMGPQADDGTIERFPGGQGGQPAIPDRIPDPDLFDPRRPYNIPNATPLPKPRKWRQV